MQRYSRDEVCVLSGATPIELAEFESRKLLVPNTDFWPPWGQREPYYRESQLEVLRWLVKARRAASARPGATQPAVANYPAAFLRR